MAGLALSSGSARAQIVWSGTGNTTLGVTDPLNWVGNVVPTTGANVAFGLSAPPTVNVPTSVVLGNITFNNTSPTPRPDYTFSGQNAATLTVGGGAGITVNASGNVSGNGNVTLDSSLPVVLTTGSHTVNVSSGPTLTISGPISQSIDSSASISKSGTGTLVLSGTNTYTGGTTLSAGTIKLGNSAALGSGTLVAAGGTVANGTGTSLTLSNSVSVTGNTIFGATKSDSDIILNGSTSFANNTAYIGSFGRTTISGTVNTANDTSNNFNFGGGDGKLIVTSNLANPAAGSAGLSVISSTATTGEDDHLTVILRGNNTFTGNVSVTASSLILDSANALPSGAAVRLSDDGYIGYTENSFSSFANFKSAITTTNSTRSSDTIIGIDSANSGSPRTVSDAIDLSGTLGSVYLGTATNVTLSGSISNPNGGTLLLTGVNNGYLKITSPLTTSGNVTSVKVGNSENEPFDVTYKGYVELAGTNSYTGGTTLKSGYLLVGNNSALGTGTLTVSGSADTGAPALAASAANVTLANDITLAVASGNSTTSDNKLIVGVPTTATTTDFAFPLQSFASNNLTLTGNITGTNALNYVGSGTLTLSGNNTYGGGTTVSSGTLQLGNGGTTGTVAGNIVDNATLAFNRSDVVNFSGVISGSGEVKQLGTGNLTLSGTNTYTGATTVNAGRLFITSDANLGAVPASFAAAQLSLNGGTLASTASTTLAANRGVTLGSGGGTFSVTPSTTLTVAGAIAGTGALNAEGGGNLTLSGSNTYGGATSITQGSTLTANAAGALPSTTSVAVTFGNLIVGTSQTIAGISGSTTGNVSIAGGQSLTINTAASNSSFGGNISDSGTLIKNGAGSLTLSGVNTYSGNTAVNAGNLILNNASGSGTGTGNVTVSSGATLTVGLGNAGGSLTGNISNSGNVTFARSDAYTYGGILSGFGQVNQSGTGTLTLSGTNTYSGATTVNSGTLAISADANLGTAPNVLSPNQLVLWNGATLENTASATLAANRGINLSGSGGVFLTDASTTLVVGGPVSGATLTKNGAGTLTLNGSNSNSSTIINAGTLALGSTGSLNAGGDITINNSSVFSVGNNQTIRGLISSSTTSSVSIADGKTLTVNLPTSGTSTFAGSLTGNSTATFAENGAGTLTLTGNSSSFTGPITINSGTLVVESTNGLGSASAGTTVAGPGTLIFNNVSNVVEPITLNGTGSNNGGALIGKVGTSIAGNITLAGSSSIGTPNSADTVTITGIIGESGGSRSLTKVGPGLLSLNGLNTYTGATIVSAGTLFVGANNAIPGTSVVTVNSGATFNVANNDTIASLTGSGTTTVAANKTLTLNSGGPLSSVISGVGNVAINNVVTVTANQTYAGNTTINGGTQPVTLNLGNNTASGMVLGNIVTTTSNTGVQFNRTDDVTYAGVISGGGFVNKNNTDTLTLTGQNTFTGNTNISGGTLRVGAVNALPIATSVSFGNNTTLDVTANQTLAGFISSASSSAIQIGSGSTLNVTLGGALFGSFYNGTVSGPGALVVGPSTDPAGGHTVGLFGNNTYTGGTTIDPNGKLLLGNNGTTGSIVGNVTDNGVLIFNRGDKLIFSGVISGNGSVSQGVLTGNTTGDTVLTGNNTYTGGTNVYSKALIIGDGGTTGSITGNVSLANNATLGFNRSDATTFAGVVSGTGSVVKASTGNLTLTGQSTYVGNTTVTGGTLTLGVANALPTTTQLSLAASSVLDVEHNQTIAGFLTAGDLSSILHLDTGVTFTVAMPVANTTTTFAGTVNGDGTFAVSGAGGDVVNLTGTVASTVGTSVGTGATLNIASGGSLSGPIALGTGSVLTLGSTGAQAFTNTISGAGSLLASAGTTTLSAPNTYTGGTVITGGKIIVSNTSGSATGTGPVVVGNGGILGGSGIITGTLVLNSGATVSPGNSPGLLTVGATTFASGATFAFDINNTTGVPGVNWDILVITGPLVISATTANPFVINLVSLDFGNNSGLLSNFNPAQSYSWQFVSTTGGITGFSADAFKYNVSQFQNATNAGSFSVSLNGNNLFLNFTPVPEPSTWALLATGLGTLGFIALRRRAKKS